jgi:monovalent cation/hydrogen antiporter
VWGLNSRTLADSKFRLEGGPGTWRGGCPTDAVAATTIAQSMGLPKRIIDLLESESLVSDASGLLAPQLSTALVIDGVPPSVACGAFQFVYLIGAGVAIGIAIGVLIQWIESHIDNAHIEITLSVVTPYVAYFLRKRLAPQGCLLSLVADYMSAGSGRGFYPRGPALRVDPFGAHSLFF